VDGGECLLPVSTRLGSAAACSPLESRFQQEAVDHTTGALSGIPLSAPKINAGGESGTSRAQRIKRADRTVRGAPKAV
jgi:hypothetical protein